MEKFDSQKHSALIEKMPFSYMSLPIYLDFCAYIFRRNGEDLIVRQDPIYVHDFPGIFLPDNPKNWERASFSPLTEEETAEIKKENIEIASLNKTETEYFYRTADFLEPKSKLKERIRQFEKAYSFKIKNDYSKEELIKFFGYWENQKKDDKDIFQKESRDFFYFCLDRLDRYGIQQVYVEVGGKLAGFTWGVRHGQDKWVGLHLKADYAYKGLSRYLEFLRAKMFSNCELFSLGTGCQDAGLAQFKKELGPVAEKQYYYVFTRDKK